MKKKLALLMAAVMTFTLVPMTAFAASTNRITKVVTAQEDSKTGTSTIFAKAPVLIIYDKDITVGKPYEFELDLTNAEWNVGEVGGEAVTVTDAGGEGHDVSYQLLTAKQAIIKATAFNNSGDGMIKVPLIAEFTDKGEATVTVDPLQSEVSGGTYTFGIVANSDTKTTIEKKSDITETASDIKPIVITETAAGSFENENIKLRLSSDFDWAMSATDVKAAVVPSGEVKVKAEDARFDGGDLLIPVEVESGDTTAATKVSLSGIKIKEDGAKVGDIAEITVSGAGISKETLEVGTYVDFGYKFTVEDKELPVMYSGRINDEDGDPTLKATFEETIKNSWWSTRKTTFTFPEGVKIVDADFSDLDGFNGKPLTVDSSKVDTGKVTLDKNVMEIALASGDVTGTVEFDVEFDLSIAPDFEGDITCTVGGAGVNEDQTVTLAKAVSPIKVTAESNPVSIDYRNVAVGDITITEAFDGALESGDILTLEVDNMKFDTTPKVEVVEGDIEIKDVTKDNSTGRIKVEIDTASNKAASTFKLTGIELFLDRSLPAGKYPLSIVCGEYIGKNDSKEWNYTHYEGEYDKSGNDEAYFKTTIDSTASQANKTPFFDTDSVEVVANYVDVVTAGRDRDDTTFTTTISVTVGATTIKVGDKEIPLDVPAYISDGYTMLPVRAVTEALSNVAIVRWDDATKTVTITFGARVISMSVGSNMMAINGVNVPMQGACEITDSRAFIPLRDLGYALGLNDSKIAWDDATKTATLN